jgi:hypothetical protein
MDSPLAAKRQIAVPQTWSPSSHYRTIYLRNFLAAQRDDATLHLRAVVATKRLARDVVRVCFDFPLICHKVAGAHSFGSKHGGGNRKKPDSFQNQAPAATLQKGAAPLMVSAKSSPLILFRAPASMSVPIATSPGRSSFGRNSI